MYLKMSTISHAGSALGTSSSFYTTDFPAHVDTMHGDTDKLFETEYTVSMCAGFGLILVYECFLFTQSISKELHSPNNESKLPHNTIKNRFGNVFPCE